MHRRVSIEVEGLAHDNPIPAACRMGPLLISSGVAGKEPGTGKYAAGIEAQCARMFSTVREILQRGGATPEDVIKMNFWIKDRDLRPHINKQWLAMFPDARSRPARHTFQSTDLPGEMLVQCEVIAYIASNAAG